ncbi:MAG TPA: TetR/AcrR family transcriptional regulator [Anaerolineaceae bacterium]|nr:TetR/AcrR family transcriptional regulator [Anaerolineaceae bacterium]
MTDEQIPPQGAEDWARRYAIVLDLEQAGLVTRTFRRLDPQRMQAVVNAILEEAYDKGPADLNIKQVAARAGVAVGSLYQYFGSRENLLAFAIQLVARSLSTELISYTPYLVEMPLREALEAYVFGGFEWSKEQAGFVRFYARAAYQGDPAFQDTVVRPIAEALLGMLREILAQAQARGEVRADLDLEAASRAVYGAFLAFADAQMLPYLNTYFQVTSAEVPAERTWAALIDLLLRGLRG